VSSDVSIACFDGRVLRPGDPGYDAARAVFNGMIDRRPALIARCSSPTDVAATLRFARAAGLPLSVYGGGHGVTGSAVVDGGVVCDLRGLTGLDVDPDRRLLRAEGGLTWGVVDAATTAHGLAVTGGRMPTTGVGGLALGSGSGWLERSFGYTCDNLVEAEVVTAEGEQVRASARENVDLFWALRGGGGNFGVVTAFHLRLHPIPPLLLAGRLVFPAGRARQVVRAFRDVVATAPDALGGAAVFHTAPDDDAFPAEIRGRPVVSLVVVYVGDPGEGAALVRPLREQLRPTADHVTPMPYVAVQRLTERGHRYGQLNYWTGDFLEALPDDAVDALCDAVAEPVSRYGQVLLVAGGGAVARVPDGATAFGQRQAPWNTHVLSAWEDPGETAATIARTRAVAAALRPWTTGRSYLNYLADERPARVSAAYGPTTYARLREIKRRWDPQNVFSHNQNIPP
jgi:FAD/FMN-containing dehydrogenase